MCGEPTSPHYFPAQSLHNTSYAGIGGGQQKGASGCWRLGGLALQCLSVDRHCADVRRTAPQRASAYFLAAVVVNSPSRTRASDAIACSVGSLAIAVQIWCAFAVSPA